MRNSFNYVACAIILSCLLACTNNSPARVTAERKAHKNIPHILERRSCLADLGLKGRVKSMYSKRYLLSGDKKVPSLGFQSLFDEQGNITESRADKTANSPELSYRSWYDANGNDTLTLEYLADGKRGDSTVCTYDKWGNMLSHISYHSNGQKWDSQSFRYNDKDSMTDVYSERMMPEGIMKVNGQYRYDSNGRLAEVLLEWGGAGAAEQSSRGVNAYDSAGRLQESAEYTRDGKLSKRTVYTYNKSGKQSSLSEYDAANNLSAKWVYTYDEKGNKTEVDIYGPGGSLTGNSTAYDYAYDQAGNIIMKTTYSIKDGKKVPVELEEITLTYY